MAANTLPIYSATPHIDSAAANNSGLIVGPTANTAQDGSGTAMYQAFQAGLNGSYIQKIKFRAVGSTAATVARLFVCNVATGTFTPGTTNTATTTYLVDETSLPAVSLSQTAQSYTLEVNWNLALNAGFRILVSFGSSTGSAGNGYSVVVIGGDY